MTSKHQVPQETKTTKVPSIDAEWHGYVQFGLIVAVILLALYFARAPERVQLDITAGKGRDGAAPVVTVFQPAAGSQALTVKLTGAVSVHDEIGVRSEVRGRVAWVSPNFKNGGYLAANETFVRVETTRFELQVKAARMAVQRAQAGLRSEKARGDRNGIAAAEADLGETRVLLELAELDLARTKISFPFDVRVVTADASVGEFVGPADAVVGPGAILGVVYRPDTLQVDAPVDLEDLEYLSPAIGRSAIIHTQHGSYEAQIVRVSSLLAPQTRMASLFFRFSEDLPPESLPLPNTFVEISVAGPAFHNVYLLPDTVLQENDGVWVVRDGILHSLMPQALGRTETGLITEPFNTGEGVVEGTLPGAREGLEVSVSGIAPPHNQLSPGR